MIERKYLAHYIDASMGDITSNYVRLGKNLETYSEELNPQVSVKRNIFGKPSVTVSGYQPQSSVETFYADEDDPMFAVLSNIANNRRNDEYCETYKVDVLLDSSGNQLWAFREKCWVIPNSVGGDTSGVQMPFTVYCSGDREYGEFDISTKSFAPSDEPYDPSPSGSTSPLYVFRNGTYTASVGKAFNPVFVAVSEYADGVAEEIIIKTVSGYTDNSLSYVGSGVFWGCSSMGAAIFNSCLSIGNSAFMSCSSLTTISFPVCTTIGSYAFQYCSAIEEANFPACTVVSGSAFEYCRSLVSASFPACYDISMWAFAYAPIVSFALTTSAVSHVLRDYAFANCTKMEEFVDSNASFLSIGAAAFSGCSSLSYVSFMGSVYAGNGAFQRCSALSTITITFSGSVNQNLFSNCHRLMSLYIMNSSVVPLVNSNAFSSTPIAGYSSVTGAYGSIYVPASLLASYKAETNWVVFSDRFVGI